ncbi:MAG: hypothetical protein GC201_04690 [Alphaproteobacteria bacterium]|nr:hypothetical protein [Alphaproteobacteria bacterium]
MAEKMKNQGEGDKESARKYNQETEDYAKSGKAEKAAKDAEKAVEGKERDALLEAERVGKSHSHGEDPKLRKK